MKNKYKVGDRIILPYSRGVNWNSGGKMNKWLGATVTIGETNGSEFRIEEDKEENNGCGWTYRINEIVGYAKDSPSEPKQDLIAEAKRRGYKIGDRIDRSMLSMFTSPTTLLDDSLLHREFTTDSSGYVYFYGRFIYDGVNWAEVITETTSIKEVGKWYSSGDYLICVTENDRCYGFETFGTSYKWGRDMHHDNNDHKLYKPVSDDVVKEAIEKEAINKGYVDGAVIYVGGLGERELDSTGASYIWFPRENKMTYFGWVIFENGEWSKIVSKPKTKTTYTSGSGGVKREMVLAEKTVVHCPTEELAKKVLKVADECGQKSTTDNISCDNHKWHVRGPGTCYNFKYGITVGWENSYTGNGYDIIPAEQFLKDNGEFVLEEFNYMKGHYHAGVDFAFPETEENIHFHNGTKMVHKPLIKSKLFDGDSYYNMQQELYKNMFGQQMPADWTVKTCTSDKVDIGTVKTKKALDLSIKSDVKKIKL